MKTVELAKLVAAVCHNGQFRRDGKTPYIQHPAAVVERLRNESEFTQAVAWLHDVIEDTGETPETLLARGIPQGVIDVVVVLSKRPDQSYEDYLEAVMANKIARKVKIADMLANLSDQPTTKQIAKYARGLLFLHQ